MYSGENLPETSIPLDLVISLSLFTLVLLNSFLLVCMLSEWLFYSSLLCFTELKAKIQVEGCNKTCMHAVLYVYDTVTIRLGGSSRRVMVFLVLCGTHGLIT